MGDLDFGPCTIILFLSLDALLFAVVMATLDVAAISLAISRSFAS